MKTFPWARAMEIGLGHLRLAPDQFWRMTLPELSLAARALGFMPQANKGPARRDFEALMTRFPDRSETGD